MLVLGLATPASAICPMAFNTGAVGSCKIFGCAASRGPTHCKMGSCYCDEGYCRYPASTVHVGARYCVQRVQANSCHLTRVCYNAGLTTSFCEKGMCMCKFGYSVDENGKCAADASMALAAMGNSTQRSAADIEFLRQQDAAVAWNVANFFLWISGFLTAVTAVATFAYKKVRVQEQEEGYSPYVAIE